MSQYISFYLKSKSGEFLPLATFSRSNVYYEYAEDFVPAYTKYAPLTQDSVNQILSNVRDRKDELKASIAECRSKLTLIQGMNNTVEEKVKAIEETNGTIKYLEEELEEASNCNMFYCALNFILEEAEMNKKYSKDEVTLDPDNYIYAGIECNFGDEE